MTFSFLDVLITVAVVLAMIFPGFVLRKIKLVPKESVVPLSVVLLYCCQPFLTLKAFALSTVKPTVDIAINMLLMMGLALAVHFITFFVVRLFFIREKEKARAGAHTAASFLSNAGFIGIPFVALLTKSDEAVIYATVFNCAFNMIMWTLGVYVVTGDRKMIRPAKAFLNPPIMVLLIALPLFFLPSINVFRMNDTVGKFVSYFGDMTLPISMLVIGIRMADIQLKELFVHLRLYIVSALKLLLAPAITLVCVLPFILTGVLDATDPNSYVILVLLMLCAMPPAASTIAISERFGGDSETSVEAFVLATVLSIATLPPVLMLVLKILG